MNHQLDIEEEKHLKTIDLNNYISPEDNTPRTDDKNEMETQCEKSKKQLSYKSSASKRSSKSQQNKFFQRQRSLFSTLFVPTNKVKSKSVCQQENNILTQKLQKDSEQRPTQEPVEELKKMDEFEHKDVTDHKSDKDNDPSIQEAKSSKKDDVESNAAKTNSKSWKFAKIGANITQKTAHKNVNKIIYYPDMHNKRKGRKQRKKKIRCLA